MKNQLLILLFFISLFSCSQEKNCSDFKTGTFKYVDGNHPDWIIVRNDSIQVEKEEKTNIELQGRLKWKSDCEYSLTYTKISDTSNRELIGKKINVTIINIADDIIEYEAEMNDKVVISKMQKIR